MEEYEILKGVKGPKDLNKVEDLNALCVEIRKKIVEVVSKNGGHLSSNLGVVELTVALHKTFCESSDRIIWDVGHQCYAHKMLTGRLDKIDLIRKSGGPSGFTNRYESEYDAFTSGHSSASISSALGLAWSGLLSGEERRVVAVLGDGALTGGLAYEGLNNAGKFKKNFVVVLNDNKMSISKNVGAMSRYLAKVRLRPSYARVKWRVQETLEKTPLVGRPLSSAIRKSKSALKDLLYGNTIFEDMGFLYYGPVDGHDIDKLVETFEIVKNIKRPVLVHVVTKKGKGYRLAEEDPKRFHGISEFNAQTGEYGVSKENFSEVFGATLCDIARKDARVCAITAAMVTGTGLCRFAETYKSRFFDVGIAEEHAVTFAGGLAAGGMIPVFAVYSSFLQRGYDQIIHDAAIQGRKIVLAVDRAGLTGEDGETHQGIFDVSFLNSIPGVTVFAPSFFDELQGALYDAILRREGICAVRYPRGGELYKPEGFEYTGRDFDFFGDESGDVVIVTYGRIFSNVMRARERLEKLGIKTAAIKLNVIKPINPEALKTALRYKEAFFFEESVESGGVGEKFGKTLCEYGFKGKYLHKAIKDGFVSHATVDEQIKRFSLDADGMAAAILRSRSRSEEREAVYV